MCPVCHSSGGTNREHPINPVEHHYAQIPSAVANRLTETYRWISYSNCTKGLLKIIGQGLPVNWNLIATEISVAQYIARWSSQLLNCTKENVKVFSDEKSGWQY